MTFPPPGKLSLPPGFVQIQLVSGLTGATAMAIARDGRVFVCEQTGTLRVVKEGKLLPRPFATFQVDSSWERGLIGVALDPAFPDRPYVYVNYVAAKPYPHHRVSRLTARGELAVDGSEQILLKGDDQHTLGGSEPAGHQGGAIHFGRDGKLYIALGDQTARAPAQRLDSFLGKLLRINPDGSIPADNPFPVSTKGKYRADLGTGPAQPIRFHGAAGNRANLHQRCRRRIRGNQRRIRGRQLRLADRRARPHRRSTVPQPGLLVPYQFGRRRCVLPRGKSSSP